jgi:acyl-CoA thioesterase-1
MDGEELKETVKALGLQESRLCRKAATDHFGIYFVKVVIAISVCSSVSLFLLASVSTAQGTETKIVLCLGDSLTAGYGLDASQAYPALLQRRINAQAWNFEVINAGVSGDTTAGGLRRLEWVLKRRVDVLILALGANDGLRGLPLDLTQKNLDTILTRTKNRYPQVELVLAGMLIPPNWGQEYFNRFQAIYPALAKKHQAHLVPFLLEGVGGRPELNLPDGIHPTAEGHQIIAENVWRILKSVLEAAR